MNGKNMLEWVRGVLSARWDPAGFGENRGRDSYSAYAPDVLRFVSAHRNLEEIARYLLELETSSLGLAGDIDRCRRAAGVLISPFVFEGGELDVVYLSAIEQLAHTVVEAALREGSFEVFLEEGEKTELQRSITRLAREIRIAHWEGDGCVEHT